MSGPQIALIEQELISAGDDLKTYFPELNVPDGIAWQDLEIAEQMVFDWEDGSEEFKPCYRAFSPVIKIYEHLAAARARSLNKSGETVERHVTYHLDGTRAIHETRY